MEEIFDLVEETRFKSREEDPLGDWEHSPDGEHLLVFKAPSSWDAQARWAKKLVVKFKVSMREAYLLSYSVEIIGRSPEVETYYEGLIEAIGFSEAFKQARALALELNKLEGHWSPRKFKRDPECWVPLPLNGEESTPLTEEEKKKSKLFAYLWFSIDRWNTIHRASRGLKGLYEEAKYLPYTEASRVWEKAKSKKKKLLAYKEMASRRVLKAFLDAKEKCSAGLGTQERIDSWVSRLPLSEETRQWVRKELLQALESHQRLSRLGGARAEG